MRTNWNYLTALLVTFVLSTGCDSDCTYSYVVKNNARKQVRVSYEGYEDGKIKSQTFYLANQEESVILTKRGINYPYDSEVYDTISVIIKLEVLNHDTLVSDSDFRKRERWDFQVTGTDRSDFSAKHTVTIQEDDF